MSESPFKFDPQDHSDITRLLKSLGKDVESLLDVLRTVIAKAVDDHTPEGIARYHSLLDVQSRGKSMQALVWGQSYAWEVVNLQPITNWEDGL